MLEPSGAVGVARVAHETRGEEEMGHPRAGAAGEHIGDLQASMTDRDGDAHLKWGERMNVGNTNSQTASTKCQYMAYTWTVVWRSAENLPSHALICTTTLMTRPTKTWRVWRPTVV